jgi:sigma-B regulation protein RsbU (phosphoserine phosphatase)
MDKEQKFILLVDDEPNITKALSRELSDWANERAITIITAPSAQIGLNLLEMHGAATSVVISDLKMPEMLGSDFLLRVKDKYPHIVSILLTGYSETQEVVKAVSAGIFSYMLKPWDSEYLLAEVQKAYEFGCIRKEREEYIAKVEEELKWAGEMQKAILKPNLPNSEGIEFRASYRPLPGLYCGGDYYDVIYLGPDRYLMLIGDVAGHGVKAAFVTGILKAVIYPEYIRNVIGKEFSPAAFLSWLNDRMTFEFRSTSSMIITFFAGLVDLRQMYFKYANAGHNHPYILRAGTPHELLVSGTGIGTGRSVMYTEQNVRIETDDTLVLYTDGLVEIECAKSKEPLNPTELLRIVAPGNDYHRRLLESALKLAAAEDFSDDVTLVTARIL